MNYLSLEQALADYAHILGYLKPKYNIPDAPVISFGGSYHYKLFIIIFIDW